MDGIRAKERRLVACEARRLGGQSEQDLAGMSGTSKMSGQALHAWSLAGGSVAICSAASAPTYSRWFQLKSDQLPRAVAKPTSLYNNI